MEGSIVLGSRCKICLVGGGQGGSCCVSSHVSPLAVPLTISRTRAQAEEAGTPPERTWRARWHVTAKSVFTHIGVIIGGFVLLLDTP